MFRCLEALVYPFRSVLALSVVIILTSGCGQSTKPAGGGATVTSPSPTASPAPKPSISMPTESSTLIQGVGTGITMTFTDPKTGKLLWTAKVKSIEAQSKTQGNDVSGTLHKVDGVLYQDGKAADTLIAPIVNVDNAKQTVIATGGVTVTSLTQANTRLTCDSVTYFAQKGKLIGRGNVVLTKAGFTQKGPSFAGDVRLKTVVMPAPGDASAGSRPVSVQLSP